MQVFLVEVLMLNEQKFKASWHQIFKTKEDAIIYSISEFEEEGFFDVVKSSNSKAIYYTSERRDILPMKMIVTITEETVT